MKKLKEKQNSGMGKSCGIFQQHAISVKKSVSNFRLNEIAEIIFKQWEVGQ